MSITRLLQGRNQQIFHCSPQDSVHAAAAILAERRIGALPVMDGESVAGIFSERDLLYCIARDGAAVLDRPVGEVMTAPAITIDSSGDAMHALSLMTRRRIRHLPVVEDGKLLAFVSIGDLVKQRIEEVEAEAEQMREYITTA